VSEVTERLTTAIADRYRIERRLGEGGMATVYLAEDLKHKRKVALKVLRPELAAVLGAERFVQEITTTASLQHPHILPLFDSGTADGFLYYVMPYIEGETLREKLNRETQFGIDEAVQLTAAIADALDYAHRNGVIHRDIKPENILLHDGRAMVADFGIALAVSAAAGGRMTETGLSLGTPHYMSPEQATAEKELSARSDVYSLGSVLYEMLTGEPPHMGNSAQQIIMKIVTDTARPVTELRKSVPPNVAGAVAKALEKLPADRFATAAEFAAALKNPTFTSAMTAATAGRPAAAGSRRTATTAVLAAVALAATATGLWGWLRPSPTPPVVRYRLSMPPSQEPNLNGDAPAAAPDGSFLLYRGFFSEGTAGAQLWLKRRDSDVATPVSGTVAILTWAISPDGRSIAFTLGGSGELRTLSLSGGAPLTVVSDSVVSSGIAWLDDGTIVFSRAVALGFSLHRVPAGGGTPVPILPPDSVVRFDVAPVALPGSRGLVFSRCGTATGCDIWVYDSRQDAARPVVREVQGGAAYAVSGHLLYRSGGALVATPFDATRLEVTGAPVSLADGIASFSLSRSGTLVLMTGDAGPAGPSYQMVWVDRTGRQTPVDTTWTFRLTQFAANTGWALSPDGSRLAVGLSSDEGDDIWIKPLPRGPASRITFNPAPDYRPRWEPDGRRVAFKSNRTNPGIYLRRADGTGSDSLLIVRSDAQEAVLSPDGRWLLMRVGGTVGAGGRDIVGMRLGEDTVPVPVLSTRYDEHAVSLSPDGRWIAYKSDETGTTEVFVRPFPDTDGGKWQISSSGGRAPLWSRDGRELFYLNASNDMMAVRITTSPAFVADEPAVLFRVPDDLLGMETEWYTPWDVARDGRFIMARTVADGEAGDRAIIVVENFLEELRARVGQ
jgi:serine/threonine-protein kinase